MNRPTNPPAGLLLALLPLLTGCGAAHGPRPAPPPNTHGAFFESLAALCDRAFEGRVVSSDATDEAFARETLIMHVRDCSSDTLRIPFHVGADRSRTWIVTRKNAGLRLKHDHRHEDGSADPVTLYGGDTIVAGSPIRQEFPADAYSKEMFQREGLAASIDNIWALEVQPGSTFAYEMRREARFFRVEFDLTRPVATPPPAWGPEPR